MYYFLHPFLRIEVGEQWSPVDAAELCLELAEPCHVYQPGFIGVKRVKFARCVFARLPPHTTTG